MRQKMLAFAVALSMCCPTITACTSAQTVTEQTKQEDTESASANLTKEDITVKDTYENKEDGQHAIEVDGQEQSYANIGVTKTGEADGDEADFYGENAAVFATNGGTLTITDSLIESNGTHANGVFSYGEATTINISDSVIETQGNCSGGLMTTGGATMNATNLTIHTTGNSSAAIRSDRGGGTVNVDQGSYVTEGTGSPVIYSTADITVSNAKMESTASQGIVIEGKNSVTLENVDLTADNNTQNSDKSDTYQAVMIYQSMSGDADSGTSSFTMKEGTLTNKNGDVFFVNNTACTIDLDQVSITNEDEDGLFLRAQAAGWGQEGSNGGKVNLTATSQEIDGDMVVDEVSVLNMYLNDNSSYSGAINTDGQAGEVYVEIEKGSTWTLTADSYVTSLTCEADAIDCNGYTLYVDGQAYEPGSASEGEAIEITTENESQQPEGEKPEGMPGEKPEGMPGEKPEGMPQAAPEE